MTLSAKPKVYTTYCIAVIKRPIHGLGNVHNEFGEVWPCGFWDIRADTQIQPDRQTRSSQYFAPMSETKQKCQAGGKFVSLQLKYSRC